MKKLLLIALVVFAGYKSVEKSNQSQPLEPLADVPYVAVYGRDRCGFTNRMLKNLKSANVNHQYHIIDEPLVADSIHSRMRSSGISTKRYNLPVVDVNGEISIRPDFEEVISTYNASL